MFWRVSAQELFERCTLIHSSGQIVKNFDRSHFHKMCTNQSEQSYTMCLNGVLCLWCHNIWRTFIHCLENQLLFCLGTRICNVCGDETFICLRKTSEEYYNWVFKNCSKKWDFLTRDLFLVEAVIEIKLIIVSSLFDPHRVRMFSV